MSEALLPDEPAIEAHNLRRLYWRRSRPFARRQEVEAVKDISLTVRRGMIFGMLGPNGAGKTTTIKMLSTLLTPTAGTARVAGYDVVRDDRAVRRSLGVVLGGDRGLYGKLSARDNLIYFGHLYGMRSAAIRTAVAEKLELVGLTERAGDRVEGYSRGMKQRLHLAKALLHDPPILILDEPTIGLDPAAAMDLRREIAALAPTHTVLLTTHDMTEADALCEQIAIVDRGLIVAQGTPEQLKARVAARRRVIVAVEALNGRAPAVASAFAAIPEVTVSGPEYDADGAAQWSLMCVDTTQALDAALSALRTQGVGVRTIRVIEPSLEDAFLAVAGRSFE